MASGGFFGLGKNTSEGILGGIMGGAGGMSSNTNETDNGTKNIVSNGTASGTSSAAGTSGYQLTPEEQQMLQQILGSTGTMLNSTNLAPYQANQQEQINTNSNLARQGADNMMAARGLATSPVAGAVDAGINNQRVAQTTNLQQQIPLEQQQLNSQNLGQATNILSSLPKTQFTNQNQNQTATQNQTSNETDQSTKKTSSGGGLGGILSGIGSALALFMP